MLCDTFADALGYDCCSSSYEVLWRDGDRRPNVFRPVLYQHQHRTTGRWCPSFVRLEVNFSPPWRYRRHYWESHEEINKEGPNYKIEITVLPSEAEALARWLPHWLLHREGLRTDPLPDPPNGLLDLLLWQTDRRHVYLWSVQANESYESWLAEQEGVVACR